MAVNPYERYKQQSVMTMTQGEMLNKLFEEIIKQLSVAVQAMGDKKDIAKANNAMIKAQSILNHLKATLNFDYEVSANLASLYDFFVQRIIAANIRKDPTGLDEIIAMIAELRDTFAQADRMARAR